MIQDQDTFLLIIFYLYLVIFLVIFAQHWLQKYQYLKLGGITFESLSGPTWISLNFPSMLGIHSLDFFIRMGLRNTIWNTNKSIKIICVKIGPDPILVDSYIKWPSEFENNPGFPPSYFVVKCYILFNCYIGGS